MRAAIYGSVSLADLGKTLEDEQLPELRRFVALRQWTVAGEFTDVQPAAVGKREGFDRLCAAIAAGRVDVVVAEHLGRLFRDDRQTIRFGSVWSKAGIRLVATRQAFDATTPEGWFRLLLALELTAQRAEFRAIERSRCAVIRHQLAGEGAAIGGRPRKTVNPLEVRDYWESGDSLREMEAKLRRAGFPISKTRLGEIIATELAAGNLDREKRELALRARGGMKRGGRPAKAKEGDDLREAS